MPKTKQAVPAAALRLVKTWLPTSLVREMDETILASGAYNGRDDFIREAIGDRISEHRARAADGPPSLILLGGTLKTKKTLSEPRTPSPERADAVPPDTLVPTLPAHRVGGILFGLHNRDYPTLWATHRLLTWAFERGAPLRWSEFVPRILEAAWTQGAQLAKMDAERASAEQKAAVGFPTNSEKRQSAEARFSEHMLGSLDGPRGPAGAIFAMRLAGSVAEGKDYLVAPTPEGNELIRILEASALMPQPPHPEPAWRAFGTYLRAALPDDHEALVRVLREIANRPTREKLIGEFAEEWPGAIAPTNVSGYVSRGREWGLIEAKLIEGRYALTDRGRRALDGE